MGETLARRVQWNGAYLEVPVSYRRSVPFLALLASTPALGATLTVGPSGMYPTIGAALVAASAGDTIQVAAGTYAEDLDITKRVTIEGAGPALTILQGSGPGAIVDIRRNFTLRGVGIDALGQRAIEVTTRYHRDVVLDNIEVWGAHSSGYKSPVLDAFYYYPTVTITNSVFRDNTSASGALMGTSASIWIEDSEFVDNVVGGGNASVLDHQNDTLLNLYGNTFIGNSGAAVISTDIINTTFGDSQIRGNTFIHNENPVGSGGALRVAMDEGTSLVIAQNVFADNTAAHYGGAVDVTYVGYWYGATPKAKLHMLNNTFVANSAAWMGSQVRTGERVRVTAVNNAFLLGSGGAAWRGEDGSGTHDYNLFFGNGTNLGGSIGGLGPNSIVANPMVASFSNDADFTNDDFSPGPGSPMIDAGAPNYTDVDGSACDIGFSGGPGY